MADATYTPLVYMAQGGSQQVVASGGSIKIETGGQILPNSGTQATTIASATGATYGTGVEAKINALIDACKGVGIIAS